MKMINNKELDKDNYNIWLIEDNLHFRRTINGLINQTQGMKCSNAFETCEEAILKMETEFPPQVILLDIGLPGMTGIEGIEKFKMLSP
ncbi:MAG: response regulator, partial [Melioribacteraceae bacterium]